MQNFVNFKKISSRRTTNSTVTEHYKKTRDLLICVALVITFFTTPHSSQKNLISYWSCCFMNFNISFERQYSVLVNIPIFCFECPSCFQLQKNPFLFSYSNRGRTQRCNSRKSHLSKLLSFVRKKLQQ